LGREIKKSNVIREEIFLTTKLAPWDLRHKNALVIPESSSTNIITDGISSHQLYLSLSNWGMA
jgi:diketogulonate reductase-like aldo/keto reductase